LQQVKMETTLNKDFKLTPTQLTQAIDFQKFIQLEFSKLAPGDSKASYYTDINNTTRFLIAREFKPLKALEMWKKWYNWRLQYKVDDITPESLAKELISGKAFWHGYDKEGHPCLVVKIKRHIPKESPVENSIRLGVYLLETGIKLADDVGQTKLCVIWDREGFTKKNYDPSVFTTLRELSGVLQDFYAERLHSLYILYPNWFFKTMFTLVKPLLNEKTKSKIKIIDKVSDLYKYFTADNLMMEYGGTSPFQYRYPPDSKPILDITSATGDDDDEPQVDPEMLKMSKQIEDEEMMFELDDK